MRPLTLAPLPAWGDVIAALLKPPVPDGTLAAPWRRPGDESFWFSRSSWSLAAIAHWRQWLTGGESVTVWIPDYFCNAALVPLRDMGARLVFYPVTDRLAPDADAYERLADMCVPDIVVLVHYFGQPVPTESVSALCRKHGAWLVEDAAHVLRPVAGIGEAGDCVLYSPHKHLPIPDGAVLVVRQDGPARLAAQATAMDLLRQAIATTLDLPNEGNRWRAILWLTKRLLQLAGVRSRKKAVAYRSDPNPGAPGCPGMSVLGRRLLGRLLPAMETAARLREERMLDWRHVLSWAGPAVSFLPATAATPYLAGFSCEWEADAAAAFEQLQCEGFPVVTWPDLAPEVTEHPERHGTAIALRRTRFYLPVHQSLKRHQVLAYGSKLLDSATRQWRTRLLTKEEWETHWRRCRQTNLLQSWQYGAAKENAGGWKAHHFLVSDGANRPVALAQVLSRGVPALGGVARLNRGPVMLDASEGAGPSAVLAALRVLLREARRRRWWIWQIAPELPLTSEGEAGLRMLGFRKLPLAPWESALIPLDAEEHELLMRLTGKWRNCMRKGEKLGVIVTRSEVGCDETDLLLRGYRKLQGSRGFVGLSEGLIRALAAQCGAGWRFNLFIARERDATLDGEPLGMLVTIESGDTAIYLIGLTNDKGRRMQANSVLLWQAILYAKSGGCSWFDVGGLGEATPDGIAEFKRGLNAQPYRNAGEYLWIRGIT